MQSLRKIEDMKKKIHVRARKVLWNKIGNFVWASGRGREEVCGSRKYFSGRERGAKERMRLLRARGSAKRGNVASGFTTQGLCLGDRKVGSQVVGKDRSRLPGRGTVGEVRRGGTSGRRASGRTKERLLIFRVRFR